MPPARCVHEGYCNEVDGTIVWCHSFTHLAHTGDSNATLCADLYRELVRTQEEESLYIDLVHAYWGSL